MCEPVSLTTATFIALGAAAAAGAAQTAIQYTQAQKQASADKKYNKQLAINADKAYAANAEETANIVAQKQASAAADISKTAADRKKAQASARVSAAEAGLSGISVDALMADYERTEATHRDSVLQSLEFDTRQAEANLASAGRNSTNMVLTGSRQVNNPSLGVAVLQFGTETAKTGANYYAARGAK